MTLHDASGKNAKGVSAARGRYKQAKLQKERVLGSLKGTHLVNLV